MFYSGLEQCHTFVHQFGSRVGEDHDELQTAPFGCARQGFDESALAALRLSRVIVVVSGRFSPEFPDAMRSLFHELFAMERKRFLRSAYLCRTRTFRAFIRLMTHRPSWGSTCYICRQLRHDRVRHDALSVRPFVFPSMIEESLGSLFPTSAAKSIIKGWWKHQWRSCYGEGGMVALSMAFLGVIRAALQHRLLRYWLVIDAGLFFFFCFCSDCHEISPGCN